MEAEERDTDAEFGFPGLEGWQAKVHSYREGSDYKECVSLAWKKANSTGYSGESEIVCFVPEPSSMLLLVVGLLGLVLLYWRRRRAT